MLENMKLNIGFVSTRLAGTDGVSLESRKWVSVLEGQGHSCFFFAGESDYPVERSFIIPEAHFMHERVKNIHDISFQTVVREPRITNEVREIAEYLKGKLHEFVNHFNIQTLVVQNAITIPMNIPLGVAITEFIAETCMPTIAHHHDFFWERDRFQLNSVSDYLAAAFPPYLYSISHVTINTLASRELCLRKGVSSAVIPNVMDFHHPPSPPDEYASHMREDLGIDQDAVFVLQPTRVIRRKRIETAIDMVHRIGRKAVLVITHTSGDEGREYADWLRHLSERVGVRMIFMEDRIGQQRGMTPDGRRVYTLADAYGQADFVTFPSEVEGFGNAFLEAVYHRKPIMVNNYVIYRLDIRPKGFRVIEIEGFVKQTSIEYIHRVLDDSELRDEMTKHNYELGKRHFSFVVLRKRLNYVLGKFFGE